MEITSNWKSESDIFLHDIVQECEQLPVGELVDILDEGKCISLTRHENKKEDDGCVIRLVSRSPPFKHSNGFSSHNRKALNGFFILSEARVIEVCTGTHEEYFKTVHGSLMGDFGDSKIFKCEVQFEKFQEVVILKLKSTYHEDSVWIFAFHITTGVDPERANLLLRNRFGGEHLSSVLKEKDVQMSKGAMKFRQMLESYNAVKEGNDVFQGGQPMNLMSMMFGSMLPLGKQEMFRGAPTEANARKKKVNNEDEIESVLNIVEWETQRVRGTQDGNQDTVFNVENALKHLALLPENRTLKESNSCMARKSESESESPMQMNKFVEKLQNYMEDGSAGPKSMMELTNILQKSVGVDPTMTSATKLWHSSVPVAGSLQNPRIQPKEEPSNKSSKPVQGEFRGGKMVLPESNTGATLNQDSTKEAVVGDLENRLTQQIEKIVEDKLTALEGRLMKKFEEKLMQKMGEESTRLDRIEGLLEKIYERL